MSCELVEGAGVRGKQFFAKLLKRGKRMLSSLEVACMVVELIGPANSQVHYKLTLLAHGVI